MLVGVIVALTVLPRTEFGQTLFLDQVKEHFGHDIQMKQFSFAILPRPSLQLVDVEVTNVNPNLESFKARLLDAEIYLLPLFFRTIILKQLTLEQPELMIQLSHKKGLTVPSTETTTSSQDISSLPTTLAEHVAIRNGSLTIHESSELTKNSALVIEDILLTLDTQSSSLPANFNLEAKKVDSRFGTSPFGITGIIDHLSPNNREPGNLWSNAPPLQFIGQANISNFNFSEINKFIALGPGLEDYQAMINLSTNITLYPERSGVSLAFSDLNGRIHDLPIQGKGNVSGLLGNDTTFFTSVSSSPINLHTLISILPPSFIPSEFQKTISEHEINGMVELVSSTIAGSSTTDIGISTRGVVRVSEGHLLVDQRLQPINDVGASIVWEGSKVRFEELSGAYQSSKIIDGQAAIQFRDSGPWADLEVTTQVDFGNALSTWSIFSASQPLHPALRNLRGTGTVFVSLHGQLNNPESLKFEEIQLQEGNLHLSKDLPPIHHVSGTVSLANNRLALRDFKAEHRSSKILNAQGNIQFQPHGPWVNLVADTQLNVQDIKTLMGKIDSTITFPKPLQYFEGEGNLNVQLKGPVNEPKQLVVEHIRLAQGRFHIRPDLSPIYSVQGKASYKHGTLRVANIQAAFRSSKIRNTSAILQFKETGPHLHLALGSNIVVRDIVDFARHLHPIPQTLIPLRALTEVNGGAECILEIQGPVNKLEQMKFVSGNIRVEDISFRSPHISERVEHLTGSATIVDDELRISSFSGQIGRSRATLRGTIPIAETSKVQNVLFQLHLEIDDINKLKPRVLPTFLHGRALFKGRVIGQQDSPKFNVKADLKEIELDIPDVIHKPAGMPASFEVGGKLQNQRIINLDHAELALPHLDLSGKGTFDTGVPFAIRATMETAPVSLASLPEDMLFGVKKFHSGDLILALDVDGTGKDWRGWQIIGSAKLNDMVAANASPEDPIRNLSVDLKLDQEQDEVDFKLEAIPINNLAALAGVVLLPLEGDLWMNGSIQGRVHPNQDPIPTLHGNLNILAKEGHIHSGKILSRILSILNLPALLKRDVKFNQANIPFNSISSDINIAKGILHTENLVLNSPTLLMSAAGTHDLSTEQLNMMVGISPLGSYTNVLKKIPLVNRLFGEDEGKLLTAFVEVKGPIQDPQVRPLPFKSVEEGAKGLIDLSLKALKRASRLPKEALQSLPTK